MIVGSWQELEPVGRLRIVIQGEDPEARSLRMRRMWDTGFSAFHRFRCLPTASCTPFKLCKRPCASSMALLQLGAFLC